MLRLRPIPLIKMARRRTEKSVQLRIFIEPISEVVKSTEMGQAINELLFKKRRAKDVFESSKEQEPQFDYKRGKAGKLIQQSSCQCCTEQRRIESCKASLWRVGLPESPRCAPSRRHSS